MPSPKPGDRAKGRRVKIENAGSGYDNETGEPICHIGLRLEGKQVMICFSVDEGRHLIEALTDGIHAVTRFSSN